MCENSSGLTSQQQNTGSDQLIEEVLQSSFQQGYPQNSQYEYSQEEECSDIYPSTLQDQQPYHHVSSYCSVNSEKPKKKKVTIPFTKQDHSFTTRTHGNLKKRTPKEKFMFLVKKLSKVCSVISDGDYFKKLSSLVAEVLVEAKSLVPLEHIPILFHEDPRPLAAPRRIRKPKIKPKLPAKIRYPEFVPDAFKLPDKKAMRIEAKEKLLAARQLRKAEREAAEKRSKAAMSTEQLEELKKQLHVKPIYGTAKDVLEESRKELKKTAADKIELSSQKPKPVAKSVLLISNNSQGVQLSPGQKLRLSPCQQVTLPSGHTLQLPAANRESSNVTKSHNLILLQKTPMASLSTPRHVKICPKPPTSAVDSLDPRSASPQHNVPAKSSTSSGEPSSSTIVVTMKTADGVSTSTDSNSLTTTIKTESHTIDTNSSCNSLPSTTVVTSTAKLNTNISPTNTITTGNVDTPAPSTSVPLISDSLSSSTLPCATPVTSTMVAALSTQVVEVPSTSPTCTEKTSTSYTALEVGSSKEGAVFTAETHVASTNTNIMNTCENTEKRNSPKLLIMATVPQNKRPRITRSQKRPADNTLLEEGVPTKHAMRLREIRPKKT
ncbi:hypothetical protein EB796_004522 [Bugula neritina]|nr:hypothetical protein EB796_004522 [Bugula neritina]